MIRKAIGAGYNVGLKFSVKDLQCALAKTAGFDGSWVCFFSPFDPVCPLYYIKCASIFSFIYITRQHSPKSEQK